MPHLPLSADGATPHERLLGHNPDVLAAWLDLERVFFGSATFDADLREQVRRALAFGNQCEYCMAKAGRPDTTQAALRAGLAVAFAELVGRDHREVTPQHIDVLKEQFSDAEVAELIAFMCFITASQMLGAIMGLSASDLPNGSGQGASATRGTQRQ